MPHTSPEKTRTDSFADLFYRGIIRLRAGIAEKLVSLLYGQKMYIASQHKGAVAACVVFWYIEDGIRKFVMTRHTDLKTANIRFVGSMASEDAQPANNSLVRAIKTTLGDVFFKALDVHLLDADRIAAAPMLSFDDPITKQPTPVQGLCWAVQITAEQAQLCAPTRNNLEVIAVPEHAMLGPDIAPAHKLIYQSVLRHIHSHSVVSEGAMMDKLEDMLRRAGSSQRTIH
ncbi:MAG: hypothetical protein GC134_05550 [Proteobacteria bacterium]|nr:hypothetical protein [Pseudomonadota bacterium]